MQYGGGADRPRGRRLRARRLAAALLGTVGVAVLAAGFGQLTLTGVRGLAQVRAVGTTADSQRFAFEHQAWAAIPVDAVFPPTYTSRLASPDGAATRVFTRIGLAGPATCGAAFDPALLRVLDRPGCGPVLRADYADATQTLVTTVGLALLQTTPAQQHDLSVTTDMEHDDLRPRALAFPGTAAAGFGDVQRVAHRVAADDGTPTVTFAVTGFADGRRAAADTSGAAAVGSGAQLVAVELESLVARQTDDALGRLWIARPG